MSGRPPKKRIDDSPWPVDMFESDPRMDKLLDAQGWVGFGVYFYLCQQAYGTDGYFLRWGFDDSATTARKMGGRICAQTVLGAVEDCLSAGLFEKELFDRFGVLTSREMQRRYFALISDRICKAADERLLLGESRPEK